MASLSMFRLRLRRVLLATAAVLACSPAEAPAGVAVVPGSLLDDPLQPLPTRLADLGLYGDGAIDAVPDVAIAYAPRWPLWSSGSDKQRFVVLPTDTTIDNAVRDAWRYPVGTLFFKTFAYDARPIETRVLRLDEDAQWEVAAYRWDEDGRGGSLLEGDYEDIVPLDGDAVHTIPSRLMCRECHESAPDMVLGDLELQLSESADGSPSALQVLDERGALAVPPPSDARRVADHATDEATTLVLGEFVANCVHCHNGTDGPSSSFDLDPGVALQNTIGRETESSASAAGVRIVPGDPGASILFLAVSGEHDDPEIEPMPPVGIDVPDTVAIENLRAFIEGLP